MNSSSELLKLACEVKNITENIIAHLTSTQISEPTFEASSPEVPQTPQYATLRASLNDTATDLLRLVNGPKTHFRTFVCLHQDLAALQTALELNLFSHVPVEGTISLNILAQKAGVDEDRIRRIMRFLTTQRTFKEPTTNHFGHTAQSVLFVREPGLYAAAHYQLDEFFKAASETATCIKSSPYQSDQDHSPFMTRFGVPLFQYYHQNPRAAGRFAQAMAGIVKLDRQVLSLVEGYPWQNISGKLVDVGGGSGHVSMTLARRFPSLHILVQDGSLDMLAQGKAMDISDLDGRVEFMQHDFFKPQPVSGVGGYLIRQVFHNWNDEDCVKILQALVPALEKSPNALVFINDTVMPEPGAVTRYEEHALRQMDIMMLVALGAKQRTEAEFRSILKQADPRFKLAHTYGNASMGLLEVHLQV